MSHKTRARWNISYISIEPGHSSQFNSETSRLINSSSIHRIKGIKRRFESQPLVACHKAINTVDQPAIRISNGYKPCRSPVCWLRTRNSTKTRKKRWTWTHPAIETFAALLFRYEGNPSARSTGLRWVTPLAERARDKEHDCNLCC